MLAQRRAMQAALGPVVYRDPDALTVAAPLHPESLSAAAGLAPASAEPTSIRAEPVEARRNQTDMPDQLKAGIESLSGMDMSSVRVHRNSGMPAQLHALAYVQGHDIHLGPGQEQHLPHEAWHVVQQRQGRVRATVQMAGTPVNDDPRLEREADLMGGQALRGAKLDIAGADPSMRPDVRLHHSARPHQLASWESDLCQLQTVEPGEDNTHIRYGSDDEEHVADSMTPNADVNAVADWLLQSLRTNDPGKPDGSGGFLGYMVGVACCVDGSYIIASSGYSTPAFVERARAAAQSVHIAGEIASSSDGRRTFSSFAGDGATRQEKLAAGAKSHGDCAAPKIVHWAQLSRDPTLTPVAMVEKWFQPRISASSHDFTHGATVAPCTTLCGDLLPWMLRGREIAAQAGARTMQDRVRARQRETVKRDRRLLRAKLETRRGALMQALTTHFMREGHDEYALNAGGYVDKFLDATEESEEIDIVKWVTDKLAADQAATEEDEPADVVSEHSSEVEPDRNRQKSAALATSSRHRPRGKKAKAKASSSSRRRTDVSTSRSPSLSIGRVFIAALVAILIAALLAALIQASS